MFYGILIQYDHVPCPSPLKVPMLFFTMLKIIFSDFHLPLRVYVNCELNFSQAQFAILINLTVKAGPLAPQVSVPTQIYVQKFSKLSNLVQSPLVNEHGFLWARTGTSVTQYFHYGATVLLYQELSSQSKGFSFYKMVQKEISKTYGSFVMVLSSQLRVMSLKVTSVLPM